MSKIPTAAWACLTVSVLALFASFVYLSAAHVDTAEFYRFLNVIGNLVGIVLGGGAVTLAGQARTAASHAAEQTNGGLDARIKAGAKAALVEHLGQDTGEVHRG